LIRSFKDKTTEAVCHGQCPKGFPVQIFKVARRRLAAVDAAVTVEDLRVPPANRLEALIGDRKSRHSIRINDQWRVCWRNDGPVDVEIVDYH
jgi:proteic killer suppression protein